VSTIIVIESRPLMRRGILQLVSEIAVGCSVHEAPHVAVPAPAGSAPAHDYALMLLSVPGLEDIYRTVAMAQLAYVPRAILLLSDDCSPPAWPRGLPPGVVGCVPLHGPAEILRTSIEMILTDGGVPTDARPAARQMLPDHGACTPAPSDLPCRHQESDILGLTPRQYEVLVLLARGYSLKAVGRHLNIAVATAKVHAETVYQRLHVHNRNEAVYAAISRGATLGWPAMAREAAAAA